MQRGSKEEIQSVYGPVYLTHDAEQAFLAYDADADWQRVRTNGTVFAIGYEPWLMLGGYSRKEGWQTVEDAELVALLASTSRTSLPGAPVVCPKEPPCFPPWTNG
jgi:hypothetical protein